MACPHCSRIPSDELTAREREIRRHAPDDPELRFRFNLTGKTIIPAELLRSFPPLNLSGYPLLCLTCGVVYFPLIEPTSTKA